MRKAMLLASMVVVVSVAGCSRPLHVGHANYTKGVTVSDFGTTVDGPARLYTLTNRNGLVAQITDYGATLVEMGVPDREGNVANVVLGFNSAEGYAGDENPYFGSTVGRVGNRIAAGRFTLDGKQYRLATNNAPNHLHGGERGFSHRLWDAQVLEGNDGPAVKFTYTSPAGEEGYPGTLVATTIYTLTDKNELRIEMTAQTDAPTIVNLVNHSYWNLAGHASGNVLGHTLQIEANEYTPTDDTLIPTGEFARVRDTPFDFTKAKPVGRDIGAFKTRAQQHTGGGYDVNFVLRGGARGLRKVATLVDPDSGRKMVLYADQPGVQLYTGNWLDGVPGRYGAVYAEHAGVCLETQNYPDAINQPTFPSPVLRPGETYRHLMVHRFTAAGR